MLVARTQSTVMPSSQPGAQPTWIDALVGSVDELAQDIRSYELIDADGELLPSFTAGAHIDIQTPSGEIRQYSLCNDPAERHRYVIAVLRDANGRGGSLSVHNEIKPGSRLRISRPRNHFALADRAGHHILVAAGIGITPIIAMISELQRRKESFHLYYCTRSVERTAFLDRLQHLIACGFVTLHHDDGEPARALDFGSILRTRSNTDHLYYCGPAKFMDAVQLAAALWPPDTVHSERFGVSAPKDVRALAGEFEVKLARSGATFQVSAGETIVEVLERNGLDVDVSCKEGYCGTCMTRYVEGQPLHFDSVLDETDRKSYVMICCARAKGPLVLDL